MLRQLPQRYHRLLFVLCLLTGTSVGLYVLRVLGTHNIRYWFMLWNLFLAWLPLLFALWIRDQLMHTRWLSWQNVLLTVLWFSFLPNSFYIISDLVHLQSTGEILKLYDAALMMSFIANGLVLGYMSVYIVHHELMKRVKPLQAHFAIAGVFISCGFAIYLGRSLGWNSWDVLLNPAGLLFDVSERFIHPLIHIDAFVITAAFFMLLGGLYLVVYQLAHLLRNQT